MAEEYTVETGQFSTVGQDQPDQALVGYFEPSQFDQRRRSGHLYLVADGVGGAGTGQVAARYAIQKILHEFYHGTDPDLHQRLLKIIQQTNAEIVARNKHFASRRPLATTLMAALIYQSKLWVAAVGDGQIFVVWDQDIEHLKKKPRPASSNPGPAAGGPKPDSLRQRWPAGLGLNRVVEIDTFSRRLFAGDTVVMCTGGLTGYVSQEEIAKTVSQLPPRPAGRRLADLAVQRGSRDPISVSITRLQEKTAAPGPTARPSLPAASAHLPAPPDWEKLSKPPPKPPLPAGPVTATTKMDRKPVVPSSRPRRGPILATAGLILVLSLGLIGFLAWRYWPASEGVEPTDSGSGAVARGTSPLAAPSGTLTPAQTGPTPSESEQQAENSSPLATPPGAGADGSTGEAISPLPTPTPNVVQATATPTPLPLPTIAVPPDCTNKGRFFSDITIKDGQEIAAGERFEKIWAVTNYGTCPWGPGYSLRFIEGDRLGGNDQPIVEVTEPEETGEISVSLVAPAAEGTYNGTWQMVSLDGETFGPELYVEIRVIAGAGPAVDESEATVLYDFIENAAEAAWVAGDGTYAVTEAAINDDLVIPFPQGIVAVGPAAFGGNYAPPGEVMLTHPHQELGFIEGNYRVETPLDPQDILVATLGFPRAAIINDDGATFEVSFKPDSGPEQAILSKLVNYEGTPTTVRQPLANVEPGQTGTFIVRVEGGDSLSYDWAVWIDLRLIRP